MTAVAVATLALEVVFLALALGWRALLQWRRTGDWGIRRPASAPARSASALLVGGFLAGAAGPVVELLASGPGAGTTLTQVAGIVLLGLAIAGTLQAQLALGSSWRVGVDPDETLDLVATGPFAVVRNPIFTWMVVAAVGIALAVPGVLTAFGAVAVVIAVQLQVRLVEEPYLATMHDAEYDRYCERVGRFVPGVGKGKVRRRAPKAPTR